MNAVIAGILGLVLIAAVVVLGPLAILWSLNTLFPALGIQYTFLTWLAAFFLSAPFVNRSR